MSNSKKSSNISFLIENDLEKAELVLSSRSILDELQEMAEDVAKMEANDLMPMLDGLKEQFGPEIAERFNDVATEQLRSVISAIKAAKDKMSTEILRMETGGNDMADNMGFEDEFGDDMENTGEEDFGDLESADDEDTNDMDMAELDDAEDESDEDVVDQIDDLIDDGSAAGRARKESVVSKKKVLENMSKSDKKVLNLFVSNLRKGKSVNESAKKTAATLGIDVDDVVQIVTESKNK